jgi:hypothetical protein
VDYVYQLTQSGIKIPVAPGIFMDTLSVFLGFFSSLFPNWRPVPAVEPAAPAPDRPANAPELAPAIADAAQ